MTNLVFQKICIKPKTFLGKTFIGIRSWQTGSKIFQNKTLKKIRKSKFQKFWRILSWVFECSWEHLSAYGDFLNFLKILLAQF